MTEVKSRTIAGQRLVQDALRRAYFSQGHPSTAVDSTLQILLSEVEGYKGAWVDEIEKDHMIRTDTGGFTNKHISALIDAMEAGGRMFVTNEQLAMITVIAIRGLYSNMVWELCEGRGNVTRMQAIRIVSQALETVLREPELIFGCDPFSENRPA